MMRELRQALTVQGRVIYALILREALGKYGKSKIGYLWALIEPVIQILVFVLVFSALGRKSPIGGDLAAFFVTGIVPWFIYNNIAGRLSGALGANQALMSYPHVSSIDVLLGRAILESVTMILVFTVIFFSLQLMGKALVVYDLFQVLTALLTISIFATGVGMVNATIRIYFDSWDKIFSAINRPLYFISGIFFTAASLPMHVRDWLQWNPIFQFVEWTRAGFFASYEGAYIRYDFAIATTLIVLFAGLLGVKATKHKARNL